MAKNKLINRHYLGLLLSFKKNHQYLSKQLILHFKHFKIKFTLVNDQ